MLRYEDLGVPLKRQVARLLADQLCGEAQNVLFTFGHSFGESDNHIAEMIAKGKISKVYVGVFSPREKLRAAELEAAWSQVRRNTGSPIQVTAFDASQCQVWRPQRPKRRRN